MLGLTIREIISFFSFFGISFVQSFTYLTSKRSKTDGLWLKGFVCTLS